MQDRRAVLAVAIGSHDGALSVAAHVRGSSDTGQLRQATLHEDLGGIGAQLLELGEVGNMPPSG